MNWMPALAPMTIMVDRTARAPFLGHQSWCHCGVRAPELGALGRGKGKEGKEGEMNWMPVMTTGQF